MKSPDNAPEYRPPKKAKDAPKPRRRWKFAFLLPLWVLVSFGVAQVLVAALTYALVWLNVPLVAVNTSVLQTALAAVVYALSLAIALGVPWLVRKRGITLENLGLQRLPSWMDILLAPAAFVVYFIVSALLMLLVAQLLPSFNAEQAQQIGFDNLQQRYEYLLAFLTLVIIAPLAEETLFRGYLYGKLRGHVPIWLAMVITSALFGAVHLQPNIAVDTFVLSLVMCSLREVTGSIWTGILLHMIKNGLAFYLLFINPTLIGTIGG